MKGMKKLSGATCIILILGVSLFFQACSSTLDSSIEDKKEEVDK